MKNSCLFHFYEYIFQTWIVQGAQLPEYDSVFHFEKYNNTVLGNQLSTRKREIWDKTRTLLNVDEVQQEMLISEWKKASCECHLCMKCIGCESFYWEQLEKALFDQGDRLQEKCAFLIPEDIKLLLEQKQKPVDMYVDHYKRHKRRKRNCLIMMKGFSSSTPVLLNYAKNTNFYSGGGFFIQWNGLGIAVDPGYMFVQNLHNCGFSVLDVDMVIVTHEHIDHSSDIRLLDDLHYNAAKNYRDYNYDWNSEDDTYSKNLQEEHKIHWYLDQVTCEEAVLLAKRGSGFDGECNELYCITMESGEADDIQQKFEGYAQVLKQSKIQIASNVSLSLFHTRHEIDYKQGDDVFFSHTFGCVFECQTEDGESACIGYTSDTSWQEEISKDMMEQFTECQIVIANISGIYEDDILLKKGKPRHLGYFGCYKIIDGLLRDDKSNLRLFLLSEFSNQITDIRYSVSRYLQSEVNRLADDCGREHPIIIPTEVGVTIDLNTFRIRCTSCGSYVDSIKVLRPFDENKEIQYICCDCMY